MASTSKRELADGSVRYDVRYRDPDGNQRTKTFRTAAAASNFAVTTEADKLRGQWIDPNAGKITLRSFAESWLADLSVDLSTREAMEIRLRNHVYPKLGRVQLRNIKASTIRAWLRSIERLSPRYRSLIFGHVSAILAAAVDDERIVKNPCKAPSVKQPKVRQKKIVPWPTERVLAVRDELPDRYQAVATVGAGLGLRQGESFGLSPDDIDWLRGTVHLRRQVKLIGTRLVFALPKYERERHVPLPDSVRDWLAAYLRRWPARTVTLPWKDPDEGKPVTVRLMVTTREAKAVTRTYFNPGVWKPALKRAGVEPTRENGTHALRHYYASALLEAGASIKAVSEYLGHADPGFTLRVYAHLMPSSAERTQKAIDAALRHERATPATGST